MTRSDRLHSLLFQRFSPVTLEIIDESHQHAGHMGARAGGETHYRVIIIADAFKGLNRVERHRLVNAVLTLEFSMGLHALALSAKAPGE